MPVKRMLPTLLLAAALSVVIAVLAAARQSQLTFSIAAALFALQVVVFLARINVPLWGSGAAAATDARWAWDNSVLTATTYGWGAAVMFTAYSLGGLVWRHWWQYGAGMALLGAAAFISASYLIGSQAPFRSGAGLRRLMQLTLVLVVAVIVALIYLIGSGKLETPKDDWAANIVFLAGGLTVLAVSVASLITYGRTTYRRTGPT